MLPLYVWEVTPKRQYLCQVVVDSIALPLNPYAGELQYKMSYSKEEETFVFSYKPKEVFVSVSCGFKMDFYDFRSNLLRKIIGFLVLN